MNKYEYWFKTWEANVTLAEIEKWLNLPANTWEVVSHSQTIHGMSILLRKRRKGNHK